MLLPIYPRINFYSLFFSCFYYFPFHIVSSCILLAVGCYGLGWKCHPWVAGAIVVVIMLFTIYHKKDIGRFFHVGNHTDFSDVMQSTTMRLISSTKNSTGSKHLSRLISALMPIPIGSSANVSLHARLPRTNTIH